MATDFVPGLWSVDREVEGIGRQVDEVSLDAVATVDDPVSGEETAIVSPTTVTDDTAGGRIIGVLADARLKAVGVEPDRHIHRAEDRMNLEPEVGGAERFRTGLVAANDPEIAFVFEVIFHLFVGDVSIVGFVGVLSFEGLPGIRDRLARLTEPSAGQAEEVVDIARVIAVVVVVVALFDRVNEKVPLGRVVFFR
jgi:hypothetical protein